MKKVFSCALLTAGVLAASSASAQSILPFSFEVRGGLGIKTEEFNQADTETTTASGGVGVGANVAFDFLPGIAVYGSYDRYAFNANIGGGVADAEEEYVDEGFAAGAKITPPIPGLIGFSPWVRGGVLFHTLELTGVDEESGRSTGFEVGGGIDIPLGMVLSFTPGVIYRQYSPDYGDDASDAKVSYFDLSLGLRARI
jgi:hypothetical protein